MELTSKVFNYTFISLSLITFIRAIVLLRKSKIERVLLSEDKRILIYIVRFLFLTLVFSVFSMFMLILVYDQKVSVTNNNDLLAIVLSALLLGFFITMIVYLYTPMISYLYGKSRYYFINHEDHGKLYILRMISTDQVMLSDKRQLDVDDTIVIIEKTEELLSTPILCEVEKTNVFKDIKKMKAKKKANKELDV
ncbi:hypothetical protein DFP94_104184 [Fontibacillus phaseoli]|uniref:Uncharacterized protein n=1 Tax=Fontibacillus phaseoli TaxID=1416533 RepID=A0A369BDU0_9BACL|nr:ABC transporter permease [Fontibacillus phaseoli]RCX19730.1 hypothetical protein DFP94_104184 [Fontibacillus phaseoli]